MSTADSELDICRDEAREARRAMVTTLRALGREGRRALDPRPWIDRYPLGSMGVAVALGCLAGHRLGGTSAPSPRRERAARPAADGPRSDGPPPRPTVADEPAPGASLGSWLTSSAVLPLLRFGLEALLDSGGVDAAGPVDATDADRGEERAQQRAGRSAVRSDGPSEGRAAGPDARRGGPVSAADDPRLDGDLPPSPPL